MSKRRFEYSDEKSNKFWEIEVNGNEHTVCYGRIGTDGQTKTKTFDDDAMAEKDAAKLVGQKTKKGYEEVVQSSSGADDSPGGKLHALLVGLCKDESDRSVLVALCAEVSEFGDDGFVCGEEEWECEYVGGTDLPVHEGVPASFHAISKVVQSLTWDGGGPEVGYGLADNGAPDADAWLFDELEEDKEAIESKGTVEASFLAGQNGLFFDPTSTLANGEPALAFIDHECCEWVQVKSVNNLDYGQILLRMLSDCMIETDHIPELSF